MNTMPKARNFIVAEEEMSRTKFYDVYLTLAIFSLNASPTGELV